MVYLRGLLLLEGADYRWSEENKEIPLVYESKNCLQAGDSLTVVNHALDYPRDTQRFLWDSMGWLPSDNGLVEALGAIPGVSAAVGLGHRDERYDQPWVLTTEPEIDGESVDQIKIRASALLKGLSYWDSPVLVRPPGSEGDALEAEWRLW